MIEVPSIETSRSNYLSIPVENIKPSPHQTRKSFDEEALKGLAESMKQEGLIEPIIVRQTAGDQVTGSSGDQEIHSLDHDPTRLPDHLITRSPAVFYELVSGERRLRAAILLGWKTIEAKVIQTVSEGEAAAKSLIENLQREDLDPIEEAEGFAALVNLQDAHWTQNRVAEVVGKSQAYISQSLRLLELPPKIMQNIRALIISRSHGLQLLRLPSAEQQLALAEQIPGKLTWEETRILVDSILAGKFKPKRKSSIINQQSEMVRDPLAEFWLTVRMDPKTAPPGDWEVSYGPHKDHAINGWNFWVAAPGLVPKAELAKWFRKMADAFGDTTQEETKVQEDLERWLPTGEAEIRQLEQDQANLRLPKDDQEQAELEALSTQGPGPVYAWVYGPDSIMAKKMESMTWQELDVKDPPQACRDLVKTIHQINEIK
jgi:ParB family chromosome partitioning protein